MDLCFQPLKNETSSFKGFQINTVQQIKIGQTQQSVEEAYCLSKRIIQIQAALEAFSGRVVKIHDGNRVDIFILSLYRDKDRK